MDFERAVDALGVIVPPTSSGRRPRAVISPTRRIASMRNWATE
jgi:hypothetical protein